MRISISKAYLSLAFLCIIPTTGFTEEKSYVCAINEVYECVTVTGCSRVSLQLMQTSRGSWCSIWKRSSFVQRPLAENLAWTTLKACL